MAKFPSQKLMTYDTPSLSNDSLTDCGVLNIPKDLSIYNRRGYASTTRSGTPLIYRMRFNLYSMTRAGQRPGLDADDAGSTSADSTAETVPSADFTTLLRVTGCQNNWTMKNAAEEYHKAREQMFRDAGVKKSGRGAYSHEIRYNYDSAGDTWLVPIDGDGDAFTGGTWDVSDITTDDDATMKLMIVGPSDIEEESAAAGTKLNIAHSYLMSRTTVPSDTNVQADETPAKFSVLNGLLADHFHIDTFKDDVIDEARNAQDNPPYELIDVSDSSDLNHDITEPVELGRALCGLGNTIGSVVVDIPFGLARMRATVHDGADTNVTPSTLIALEVLDIYEMQG